MTAQPFPNICHALRGWCAANGCVFISCHIYAHDWAECFVVVDADTWILACGPSLPEMLAMLDGDMARHRAGLRRATMRVIQGGRA